MTTTTTLPKRIFPELDELSENKLNKIDQFYKDVWVPMSEKNEKWPTCYKTMKEEEARLWCYKFMVARKFDQEEAKKMLETVVDFRAEFKTEDRPYFPSAVPIKGFNIEEVMKFFGQEKPRETNEEVDRIYEKTKVWQSICFHKTDKWGHVVSYECWGRQHPYYVPLTLKRLVTNPASGENYTDVAMKYHVHMVETGLKLSRFQDQTWAKDKVEAPKEETNDDKNDEKKKSSPSSFTRVSGILCVCDMTGLSMGHFVNDFINYLSRYGDFDKKVYPEVLHHVLVINCPALIRMAFAVVSPLIDARTQTKISFHAPGEATDKALRQWIDEENIPAYLGGKCKEPFYVPDYDEQEKLYQELLKKAKDGSAEVEDGVAQTGIEVAAGKNFSREIILKKDDSVTWDWLSDEERTIEFSVVFESDEPQTPTKTVLEADKIGKHAGSHTAHTDGKVKLVFGNEFSWLRSKYLTVRTSVFSPSKLHIDGEKKEEHEKEDKKEEEQAATEETEE